ncbi:uba domain-containing protein ucp14 [Phlyctema vagabunda]|uniref:Uba domain-containing protein ucp14 n=1 Tax=Phlyctema vagabunda TaxID=108571 RepID=A0ABR4PUZ4_9HELO
MLSSGFTDAPVSRSLAYGLVAASIVVSVTDSKHLLYIQVEPHLWRYHQAWRLLSYQACYTNSTEVLFAAMTLYNMRVIERLWGSRKFASFLVVSYLFTALLPPLILALFLRPLSFHTLNYLPAGPTPLIFALLAQYHAVIPHVYKYRLAASATPPTNAPFMGLTFSDKSYVYLPAVQLSLSQFPGSLICACVGWVVGYSWRNDVLPAAMSTWRVPGWLVGVRGVKRAEDFEGLRRRLEGENANAALATGSDGRQAGEANRRRTLGRQLIDQFRGAF